MLAADVLCPDATPQRLMEALRALEDEDPTLAVEQREGFRQVSYIRLACIATITGCGTDGYLMAVDKLLEARNEA